MTIAGAEVRPASDGVQNARHLAGVSWQRIRKAVGEFELVERLGLQLRVFGILAHQQRILVEAIFGIGQQTGNAEDLIAANTPAGAVRSQQWIQRLQHGGAHRPYVAGGDDPDIVGVPN